jgi:hypothetical protein
MEHGHAEVNSIHDTQRDNHLEERQFFVTVVVLTATSYSYRHSGQGYCKRIIWRKPSSVASRPQ